MYGGDAKSAAPTPLTAADKRRMDALLNDLEKRLAGIREGISRATEFRHRLMDPRPAEANKAQAPEPNPQTIEGRLAASVRYADMLAQDLHELCGDLDRAA